MEIGSTFLIVGILIAGIWIFIELKRMKHKIFAIILIFLILFSYFSFSSVINQNDVDLKSIEGLKKAGSLYFIWLSGIFKNFQSLTTHAVKLDWKGDENLTIEE